MNDFYLSREQVRELDRRAIEEYGVPGIVLMENAGRGCAELLMRLNPERLPTVILCGPGNNGGDGFVVARHLDNARWPLMVWLYADQGAFRGDAAVNHQVARKSWLLIRDHWFDGKSDLDPSRFVEALTSVASRMWVVDALFGSGLNRPIEFPASAGVEGINRSGAPVLAIDIPSGLDCDTGEPLGPTIRATHTATFVAPKLGFRNPNAKQYTGEVHVIDIGAPRVLVEQYRQANARNS